MESVPTASVTGRHDWEWNRLQADRAAADGAEPSACPGPQPTVEPLHRYRTPVPGGTAIDARALEAVLEDEAQRRQAIITRYERLLEEKDRQLAAATVEPPTVGRGTALLQAVRRLIATR